MNVYISFGKDKNKESHIVRAGSKRKLEFSIIVSQRNKVTNQKEYAYMKAETWNEELIKILEEGKRYKINDSYFRFYKSKNNELVWVLVIKQLAEKVDFKEFDDIFNENNDEEPWELKL